MSLFHLFYGDKKTFGEYFNAKRYFFIFMAIHLLFMKCDFIEIHVWQNCNRNDFNSWFVGNCCICYI